MYVRSAQALAWLDTAASDTFVAPCPTAGSARPRCRPRVIPARKPFEGRLGRYIAVRLAQHADGIPALQVAVANRDGEARGPRWVRAADALSEREAARWAREGF